MEQATGISYTEKTRDSGAVEKATAEKTRIQRQINTTDKQIDKLVYELYNLTAEEIKIVEKSVHDSS